MKKYITILVVLVSVYFACNISITPRTTQGSVGDKLDFKVTVKHIHLPCLLAINATEFKYDNVSLIKESGWDSINPVTFEKTITVRLDREGKGGIEVSRTCPIRTSEAKVAIDIKGTGKETDLTTVIAETKKWVSTLSKGDTLSLQNLKSLKEWLSGNYETYLPKTSPESTRKKIAKFLVELDEVLALADSLKKAASELAKSEIFN